jgi:hypothetical protein
MKHQNLLAASLRLLVLAVTVVSLTGAAVAQAAALPNQITVASQELNSGVVIISSVTAAQNGWVVIYKNANLSDSEIVGYAPVYQGANTNVKVTINTAKVGDLPTLWAVLHVDGGIPGRFEWGLRNQPYDDGPVMQNGWYVIASFGTSASMAVPAAAPAVAPKVVPASTPAPAKAPIVSAPATDKITATGQDLNSGVIVINSVVASQDGWVVIYMTPDNLTAGEIVGYAPVYQGTNTNVKVTINTARVGDAPTLWAVLQADNSVKGQFEWGLRGLGYNDGPVTSNGHTVVAAFDTYGQ